MANKSVGLLNFVFGANLEGFQRALKKGQKSLSKFGRNMEKTGRTMTMSLTLPIAGLGAASVKLASDFEETDAKFNTVFSSIQEKAEETAKNFKENFGLSELAAKDMLGATGDLLVGFGFTEDKALELSNSVNELAVDLASFTNFSGGAKGASEALTKALLGERESIKSLGIAITETDLKAYAADQGLVWKELDRVTKATLTFEMAQKQSSKAIGDFARTQDSFANQMRVLKGDVQDLAVEFGQALLPLATKLVGFFSGLVEKFSNLNPQVKENIALIGLLAAALGPLIFLVGKFSTALVFLSKNPMMLVIAAVTTIIASFYDMSKSIQENLHNFGNTMKSSLNVVIRALNDVIDGINNASKAVGGGDLLGNIKELKIETKKFGKETKDTVKELSALEEISQSVSDATSTQIGEVAMLRDALIGSNGDLDMQNQILTKLKKISPEYFGSLKTGASLIDDVTTATQKYTLALQEQARVEAIKARLTPLFQEQLDIELKMQSTREKLAALNAKGQRLRREGKSDKAVRLEFKALKGIQKLQKLSMQRVQEDINEILALAPDMSLGELVTTPTRTTTTTTTGTDEETQANKSLSKALKEVREQANGVIKSMNVYDEKMSDASGQTEGLVVWTLRLSDSQKLLNAGAMMFGDILTNSLNSALDSQENFFQVFVKNIKQAIRQLLIQLAVMTLIKALMGGGAAAFSLANIKGNLASIMNVQLADGGIVTSPTAALIGEAGPEAVIPLDKLNQFTGVGNNNTVQVEGVIRGNDIFLSNARTKLNRKRTA